MAFSIHVVQLGSLSRPRLKDMFLRRRSEIIRRTHDPAVGPGRRDQQDISCLRIRDHPIVPQHIAGFADGPDDGGVHECLFPNAREVHDLMTVSYTHLTLPTKRIV